VKQVMIRFYDDCDEYFCSVSLWEFIRITFRMGTVGTSPHNLPFLLLSMSICTLHCMDVRIKLSSHSVDCSICDVIVMMS
jgi:hypothetical protein